MLPARRPRFLASAATIAATLLTAPVCALAAVIPAQAQTVNYVALGDSYSSGVGAGSYIGSSGACERSSNAFSQLWANAHPGDGYVSVACSGATTSSVISSQLSALSSSTTLVSITVGGNDVGFATTMETCVLQSTSACVAAVQAGEAAIASTLPGEMNSVLGDIRQDAPGARVVVLDYPELYDLSQSPYCVGLSTTDRTDLNQAADQLDAAIQAAAARYGDSFGEVKGAFSGHEICDYPSWLHAVNFLDVTESYHPTASGQANAYYPVFSALAGS